MKHRLCFRNLILGCTPDSLSFSAELDFPIVALKFREPLYLSPPEDSNNPVDIFWKMIFLASLAGNIIGGKECEIIRIDVKKKKVYATTNGQNSYEILYDNLYVFDDEGVAGLPEPLKEFPAQSLIIDWIDVCNRRGIGLVYPGEEDCVVLKTSGFCHTLVFYPSTRINVFTKKKNKKDVVVFSSVPREQVLDEKFSAKEVCDFLFRYANKIGWKSEKRLYSSKEKKDEGPSWYNVYLHDVKREVRLEVPASFRQEGIISPYFPEGRLFVDKMYHGVQQRVRDKRPVSFSTRLYDQWAQTEQLLYEGELRQKAKKARRDKRFRDMKEQFDDMMHKVMNRMDQCRS